MESQDSPKAPAKRQNLQMTQVYEVRTTENVWKSEDFLDLPEYLLASLLSAAANRMTIARGQNEVATTTKDKPARTPNLPPEARRPARGRKKSAASDNSVRSDRKSRTRSFAESLYDVRLDSRRKKERPTKSPIRQRALTRPGNGRGQTVTSKELRAASSDSGEQKESTKTKSVNSSARPIKFTNSPLAAVSKLDPTAADKVSSDLRSNGCVKISDYPPGDVRQNIVEC